MPLLWGLRRLRRRRGARVARAGLVARLVGRRVALAGGRPARTRRVGRRRGRGHRAAPGAGLVAVRVLAGRRTVSLSCLTRVAGRWPGAAVASRRPRLRSGLRSRSVARCAVAWGAGVAALRAGARTATARGRVPSLLSRWAPWRGRAVARLLTARRTVARSRGLLARWWWPISLL